MASKEDIDKAINQLQKELQSPEFKKALENVDKVVGKDQVQVPLAPSQIQMLCEMAVAEYEKHNEPEVAEVIDILSNVEEHPYYWKVTLTTSWDTEEHVLRGDLKEALTALADIVDTGNVRSLDMGRVYL